MPDPRTYDTHVQADRAVDARFDTDPPGFVAPEHPLLTMHYGPPPPTLPVYDEWPPRNPIVGPRVVREE